MSIVAIFTAGIVVIVLVLVFQANADSSRNRGRSGSAALSSYVAPPPVVLPESPISVTIRKALMGEGYVLKFYNGSERHLLFTVAHRRPTLNQQDEFTLRLDPGRAIEQGWDEGHTFYPGDLVDVKHPDFRTKTWSVNPK